MSSIIAVLCAKIAATLVAISGVVADTETLTSADFPVLSLVRTIGAVRAR
jgi:hypothetical protein